MFDSIKLHCMQDGFNSNVYMYVYGKLPTYPNIYPPSPSNWKYASDQKVGTS